MLNKMPGQQPAEREAVFGLLLQITALFHDAGRYGDGPDKPEWEQEGSEDCSLFIAHLLKNSGMNQDAAEGLASEFTGIITHKDSHQGKHKNLKLFRPLAWRILHDADCIDIIRCSTGRDIPKNPRSQFITKPTTRHFKVNYLDFWNDATGQFKDVSHSSPYIDERYREEAQRILLELILEWRSVIKASSDLATAAPIEIDMTSGNGQVETVILSPGTAPQWDVTQKTRFEYGGIKALQQVLANYPLISRLCDDHNVNEAQDDNEAKDVVDESVFITNLPGKNCLPLDVALVNLRWELNQLTDAELKKSITDATQKLLTSVNDRVALPAAIKRYEQATQKVRGAKQAKVAAAVSFVAITLVSAIIGATIGLVIGMASGAFGGPIGSALAGFAGFIAGTKQGIAVGSSVAMVALALGGVAGVRSYRARRCGFFSQSIDNVIEAAHICTKPMVNP